MQLVGYIITLVEFNDMVQIQCDSKMLAETKCLIMQHKQNSKIKICLIPICNSNIVTLCAMDDNSMADSS